MMNRTLLVTSAALVVSLGINAWQLWRRPADHRAKNPAPGISNANCAARHPHSPEPRAPAASNAPQHGRTDGSGQQSMARSSETLDEILAMRDPMGRAAALLDYARELPLDQIPAALEQVRGGRSRQEPESQLLAHLLLTRWAQDDPEAALASLNDRAIRDAGFRGVSSDAITTLASLATTDPARAVSWLNGHDNRLAREYVARTLAYTVGRQWALQDPDAALQWAAGLPDRQRSGAYFGIIGKLATTDLQRAASLTMELDSVDRRWSLGAIGRVWARESLQQAVSWAESLEGADRNVALGSTIGVWATSAPGDAAAYVSRLPVAQLVEHMGSVATTWAHTEPAAAAEWLVAHPECGSKAAAMEQVMWNYANADPDAAVAWLGQQEPGYSYDRGVIGLAKAAIHVHGDPEAGANWTNTIGDEKMRGLMTQYTLQQWMRDDPAAAQQWAAKNGVQVSESEPPSDK